MNKQILSWVSPDPERFYSLKGTGFSEKFEFRRSQSVDNTAFLLALKTGLSGLPAYNGRTVTVTGTFPNAVTVEFSGSTEAVMLVPDGGVTDSFTVTNGVSPFTVNNGASFNLAIAEGALQTNQRTLGGQFAGVVAKGSSVANTGPGKSQAITYSGNGPITIGGVTVDITTPESVNTLVGRIKTANPTRTTLTGTGTITKAAPEGYEVISAGTNGANGRYTSDGTTENGAPHLVKTGYLIYRSSIGDWCILDIANGNSVLYQVSGGAASPPQSGWVAVDGATPAPTVNYVSGTPASVNITLTDNASAGNVADLPVTGTGATSNSTAPQPNGTADFKLYYPTGATPVAPGVTGTGAAIVRTFSASQVGLNVAVPGVDNYNYLTAATTGPIVNDSATPTNLGGAFTLQIASLDTAELGATPASFKSKIQHSDDGVTFTDLVTFDDLTTKTSSTKSVPKTTAIKPYVRFSVTDCVGRWAPSVAFSRQP